MEKPAEQDTVERNVISLYTFGLPILNILAGIFQKFPCFSSRNVRAFGFDWKRMIKSTYLEL